MKPIDQEFHTLREDYNPDTMIGDCWRACVASFLELPLEEVPHFAEIWEKKGMMESLQIYYRFLIHHGWMNIEQAGFTLEDCYPPRLSSESSFYFVSGVSPRNKERLHLTIWKDGEMVHDPHPSRQGITKVTQITRLFKV